MVKLLRVDFNAIQKAMEDVARDKYDYFLNIETGKVITISVEALEAAGSSLSGYEESDVAAAEDYEMPEWIEKEVELALRVFSEGESFVRIPERESAEAFSLMKKFIDGIEELKPHDSLSAAIIGPNSFGNFKKTLSRFPEYRKKWFAYNTNEMKKTITVWLDSIGVKPEQGYY